MPQSLPLSLFEHAAGVGQFGLRGKGVIETGKQDLGSIPLRLSFLFKSCGLWILSFDFDRPDITAPVDWA